MKSPTNPQRKRVVSAALLGFLAGFGWARLTLNDRRKRAQAFIRTLFEEFA